MEAAGAGGMNMMGMDSSAGGDRFPQWSVQETRDFLIIRGELDGTFMETKRNKVLWEVISAKMKERGYNRTPDQCKCKWKNLVTRYKGFETMEEEGMRQQFPFYNELQAIFTGRMQRMLWMEAGSSSSKKRPLVIHSSSDDDNEVESDVDEKLAKSTIASHYKKRSKNTTKGDMNISEGGNNRMVKEILEELMKQQMQTEMEWMKLYESKEEERRMREMEWRSKMEALENDRIMFDKRWREREEQRRIKEEIRSEKRDALITLLLNKLTPQHHL